MNSDMEFFLYWQIVRKRYMPILEQQKEMWEKAKHRENVAQIEEQVKPFLNITTYEEAKELLMICKEEEKTLRRTSLTPLKTLFTALKDICIAVAKETKGLPRDYLEFISKLNSPRAHATIANSRWAKLKESSGSDNDNHEIVNHAVERIVDSQEITDLLPRTAATTSEVKSDINNRNPEIKGMIPKM